MSFMLFWKKWVDGKLYYENANDEFNLAGNKNGLIHKMWVKRGKPVEQGWTTSADELLKIYADEYNYSCYNGNECALIVDFHPGSQKRIGIIEIDTIHVYTYGDEDYVEWSPLMLELTEVYSKNEISDFSDTLKQNILNQIEVSEKRERIVEFLYLNGDKYSWNWGKNGATNAVFLYRGAIEYFKKFL